MDWLSVKWQAMGIVRLLFSPFSHKHFKKTCILADQLKSIMNFELALVSLGYAQASIFDA